MSSLSTRKRPRVLEWEDILSSLDLHYDADTVTCLCKPEDFMKLGNAAKSKALRLVELEGSLQLICEKLEAVRVV